MFVFRQMKRWTDAALLQ